MLASQYAGETAYVFSCGPSLGDIWNEQFARFLEGKLVIAVKQSFSLMPLETDFHIFNRCRMEEYQYPDPVPVRMAVEIEPFTTEVDIRLPFVFNPDQKWLSSVLFHRDFERWSLARGAARCYGPGIMLELGIFLPVHLGCKKVVFFGWDMNPAETSHFYADAQKLPPVHLEEHVVVSNTMPQFAPHMLKWYESNGIKAFLCSPRSGIPLPSLTVQQVMDDASGQRGPTPTKKDEGQSVQSVGGTRRPVVQAIRPPAHAWIPHVTASHFQAAPTEDQARNLFKSAVQMVEIEVHSHCNRRCWFCSNTVVDRRSGVHLMAPDLYRSILRQLAEIQYDRTISFSRYNEPFSQPVIFERLAEARAALPLAKLHSNTNGDYLRPETMQKMADAGLNSLSIQCYLKDTEQYDHDKIRRRYDSIARRLGLNFQVTKDVPGQWFEGEVRHAGMHVRLYGRNFAGNGTSRGDIVDIARDYVRQSPCLSPFWHFYVDWNGSVMPCCNLRSEVPTHREAILATLTPESSLFLVFAGERVVAWRRHLASFEPKEGLCRSCRFVTTEPDAALEAHLASVSARPNPALAAACPPLPSCEPGPATAAEPRCETSAMTTDDRQTSVRPRFLSFLLPFIDRGHGPLCQWIMELQAACLGPDGVGFIGDDHSFQTDSPWGEELDLFGFRYRCPTREEWERHSRHVLGRDVFAELERRSRSMLDAFRILLAEDYVPLREALETMLAGIGRKSKPEAILSWCHVPSLKLAAAKFGIPVIHNELGPLRLPIYQSTVYFDFSGVNGFTSATEQMRQFAREASGWSDFQPLTLAELRDLLVLREDKRTPAAEPPAFKAGIALQVEDDSNLLAFAKGMSNFELIHAVRWRARREEILIRHHPHGHARYSDKLGALDQSADSIEFLGRCQHLYTTNSSVAFEALLQGVPMTVLGDSPAAGLSHSVLEAMSPEERQLSLNWLFIGYLVPAARLFDPAYYSWRLSRPSLREIYERHLAEFRAERERRSQTGPDLERVDRRLPSQGPTLTELNRWRAPVRERLERRIQELERDNRMLQRRMGTAEAPAPNGSQEYLLIPHLNEAARSKGLANQVAIWEATIDGVAAQAIYMQPPAELVFRLPTGARGRFSAAVAIHPDAWDRADAGGCVFHVRADSRLVCELAIDPTHQVTDRRWHEVRLDIPENPAGFHDIVLGTRGIGSDAFRWALWRTPDFVWAVPSPSSAEIRT